ncbi:hypothetical protein IE4872_PD01122 (plasmid) [Rhizobium gallicum]|uniref:Uncharacterized protein n=1 Tax=Rhizobium gallicum TaxID=56730 RepID=A0A1L5NUV9_9HYPH|nr:hypothetical protein IE4872_PD01122 [Rhizobium gallicum]
MSWPSQGFQYVGVELGFIGAEPERRLLWCQSNSESVSRSTSMGDYIEDEAVNS